jgi:hypothetical protein
MSKRNNEWRSIPEVAYIEVTRDGEVRYQKGQEQYVDGMLTNPMRHLRDAQGNWKTVQQIITKAFPDIPMRYPQKW